MIRRAEQVRVAVQQMLDCAKKLDNTSDDRCPLAGQVEVFSYSDLRPPTNYVDSYTQSSRDFSLKLTPGKYGPELDCSDKEMWRIIDRKNWRNGKGHVAQTTAKYFEDASSRNYLLIRDQGWRHNATWVTENKQTGDLKSVRAHTTKGSQALASRWLCQLETINPDLKGPESSPLR